jgi:flagellar assembly factor FliW
MSINLSTLVEILTIVFAAGIVYNKVNNLERQVVLLWKRYDTLLTYLIEKKGG